MLNLSDNEKRDKIATKISEKIIRLKYLKNADL